MRDLLFAGGNGFIYISLLLGAIYYLYGYKVHINSVFDFIYLLIIYVVIHFFHFLDFYFDAIMLFFVFLLLLVRYKEHKASVMMFSFVIFSKIVFSFPVYYLINASSDYLESLYGLHSQSISDTLFLNVLSLITALFFMTSVVRLKKTIDIRRERLFPIYIPFSIFVIVMILIVSYLQGFVYLKMSSSIPLVEQHFILFYKFVGLMLFPFLGLFLLKTIFIQDVNNEALEKQLLEINNTRMLAYRYMHNINSIMLTMTILAKKKDKKGIIEYLDNVKQ